jgi:hypothetical protein
LRGERSVLALPACFLERCLGAFAAESLLAIVFFFLLEEFADREFAGFGRFLMVTDWRVLDLVVPERTDTTVPTAVPSLCATSVKTLGSARLESLLSLVGTR